MVFRKIWSNWQLSLLTVIALGCVYGGLASFARVYDLRLIEYDVDEALKLILESYVILESTVILLSIVVFALGVTVIRLSSTVKRLEQEQ